MRVIYRLWAMIAIAFRRILSQPWMALATVLGMVFAIALSMSVPLYTSSVYNRIFLQRVGALPGSASNQRFPPFSFMFSYDSSIYGNLQWQNLQAVNDYLKNQSASGLGLPVKQYTRYFATDPLALFPASVQQFLDQEQPLMWSSLAFMDQLEQHATLVEGRFPQFAPDGPIEVMVYEDLANELGVQVGETYTMFARGQLINGSNTTVTIPVRVAGIFQAANPQEDYWFIQPAVLKERLMVPEQTFVERVSPALSNEIYTAFWFIAADGSSVRPEQAMDTVNHILSYAKTAGAALPKIKLIISPVEALYSYQRAANLLTLLLFAFSVPIFGLLLAFISMTAGMTVERQRNEIAILRSRGAMTLQMLGMAAAESLLLGGVALAVGLPLAGGIALLVGKTRSFLDFTNPSSLDLRWTGTTLYFGLGAIGLTLLARLLPTLRAARDNIIVYKRERSRSLSAPLWQRIGLDFMLLIPAVYGLYQLRQSGSIDMFGAAARGDPFANPLLIMIPALAIFALSLFCLRLMPLVMRLIAWATARTGSVGVMMAARHLARTPSTYTLPLVLLILTLSLSAFTATLAGTLDHHLHDQIFYRIGADVDFKDLGDNPDPQGSAPGAPVGANTSSGLGIDMNGANPPGWFFLPVSDYLHLTEVTDATRVGRYQATALFGGDYQTGEILGIDWSNLTNIAFWRTDFANESLGELMNRLAAAPDGLLVNQSFLTAHSLLPNDLITLRIVTYQQVKEIDFHVVGSYRLFPTYYPGEKPLFIGNLDYIFESVGAEYPYDVWLKTAGPVDVDQLASESYNRIGARTISWVEPVDLIDQEQARPERQGLFGVLSVGFAAAALLTVLGFLLYALLSFQRRYVELGVLRAIGLSTFQMTILLASELAFLILLGGMIGTVLGVWVSNNFIPYLQIGADAAAQIPPYVVYIAWPAILRVYALFGLLFIAALTTLVILLRRMRIFEAVKMGETV